MGEQTVADDAGQAKRRRPVWLRLAASAGVVIVIAVIAGGLTSFAQTVLPPWFASFANSASGWTTVTFAAVYASRARPVPAAFLGAVAFVLMNESYGVVSTWRGYVYVGGITNMWNLIGLLVGPIVGLAAAWLRSPRPVLVALGAAAPAIVLIGEGVYGLTFIADSTEPGYWIGQLVVGVLFLAWVIARRVRSVRFGALAIALTTVGAALFLAVYSGLPSLLVA
jgi:hypothetical protein